MSSGTITSAIRSEYRKHLRPREDENVIVCFDHANRMNFGALAPFLDQKILRYVIFANRGWSMIKTRDPVQVGDEGGEYDCYDNPNARPTYLAAYRNGNIAGILRLLRTDNSFVSMDESDHPILSYMMRDMVVNARKLPKDKRLSTIFNQHNDPEILKMIRPSVRLPESQDVLELSRLAAAPDLSSDVRHDVMGSLFSAALTWGMLNGHKKIILLTYPKVAKSFFNERRCRPAKMGRVVTLDNEQVQAISIGINQKNLERFNATIAHNPMPRIIVDYDSTANNIIAIKHDEKGPHYDVEFLTVEQAERMGLKNGPANTNASQLRLLERIQGHNKALKLKWENELKDPSYALTR